MYVFFFIVLFCGKSILTDLLWVLSRGTVTFLKGYLVEWVIPEKKFKQGQSSRAGG